MSLLLLFLGGTARAQASAADFSASPTEGLAPLTVQFSDSSTGSPDAWSWDFQNDGTVDSTEQNPLFTYNAMGLFSVKLTASNASGSTETLKENLITATVPDLWTRKTPLEPPSVSSASDPGFTCIPFMAFDSARGHIVMYLWDNDADGDGRTWIRDGACWTQVTQTGPTPPTLGWATHAIAYDNVRDCAVLFSGMDRTTWEWNGSFWAQRPSASAPSARNRFSMAYDAVSRRVILFGGQDSLVNPLDDTWAWDGTNWTQLAPATKPPARCSAALATDAARQRIVLFGGAGQVTPRGHTYYNDTWTWDGANWTQSSPATNPDARYDHAMACDSVRQRVVLFGGNNMTSEAAAKTWEWDGTNWAEQTPANAPPARSNHAMAFDTTINRVVLFGGATRDAMLDDTWEWDGVNWTQPQEPATPNPIRNQLYSAAAYDNSRQRVVMFGGNNGMNFYNDLWEWDGAAWSPTNPSTSPPGRYCHALAYDTARERLVLFGGLSFSNGASLRSNFGDTWEWDGAAWTQMQPSTSPCARYLPSMAYDSDRRRVVLFGGSVYGRPGGGGPLTDTWEWDGANWTQASPATSPTERGAMAYDAARQKTVMVAYDGTWLWDGTDWTKANPVHPIPPSGIGTAVAYDSVRERLVAVRYAVNIPPIIEMWEWDGADWTQRSSLVDPGNSGPMAYDAARGCVVLFGNVYRDPATGAYVANETWEYRVLPAAAFSATPSAGVAPLDVQFSDRSTLEPASWAWDFENDGTVDSTERNPGHLYRQPGRYTVKLTVGGASGSSAVLKDQYITADPPPARARGWTLYE